MGGRRRPGDGSLAVTLAADARVSHWHRVECRLFAHRPARPGAGPGADKCRILAACDAPAGTLGQDASGQLWLAAAVSGWSAACHPDLLRTRAGPRILKVEARGRRRRAGPRYRDF